MMADLGIIRHDVPVSRGKGEVGADVEFALTCYQVSIPNKVVLRCVGSADCGTRGGGGAGRDAADPRCGPVNCSRTPLL
jgi:hypothetical protein